MSGSGSGWGRGSRPAGRAVWLLVVLLAVGALALALGPFAFPPDGGQTARAAAVLDPAALRLLDDRTRVTLSSFRYNRATQTYLGTATVANTAPERLDAPLYLVVAAVNPTGASMVGATGLTTAGQPYYDLTALLPAGALAAGATSQPLALQMKNPSGAAIQLTLHVYGPAAADQAPVADAGPDQTVGVGAPVILDGSASHDPDGDRLTFAWAFAARPADSAAVLDDPTAVDPRFDLDRPGDYDIDVVVHDGNQASAPDRVRISTANSAPVADAGPDQTAPVGAAVALDGSRSHDVDGDRLSYAWTLTGPAGSTATPDDPTAVLPRFTIDRPGEYVGQLVVDDGRVKSAPDHVTVTTENTRPVADAGPDRAATVGATVTLDGSRSHDVDGDPLAYRWSLASSPPGSAATLADPTAATPSVQIDRPGLYVAQLIVRDGRGDSAPDNAVVTTENARPLACPGPDRDGFTGDEVLLDGRCSRDPDGDPLQFQWALLHAPAGSTAALDAVDRDVASLVPDRPGLYLVQLVVGDGELASAPATARVQVAAGQHPPTITSTPVTTATVGQPYRYDVNATDLDGDPLTYSLPTTPMGMTIDAASGLIAWTPAQAGGANVKVRVTDSGGLFAEQSFAITVAAAPPPANHAPTITSTPVTTATAGQPYTYDVDATDPDAGDVLTYSLPTAPQGMTINSTSGLIQWTPTAAQVGAHPVTVRVTDAGGLSVEQSFSVTVGAGSPTNQPPTLSAAGIAPQWTQLAPTGTVPTQRARSGSGYDTANDRLIVFGGEQVGGAKLNDVWVLVNATGAGGAPAWVQLAPTGGPPTPRHGGIVAYDPTANRLIIYGGCSSNCAPALGDAWVLTNANGLGGTPQWIQLPSTAASSVAGAAYDPISNRLMVFGGLTAAGPFSDLNTVRVLVDANGIGEPRWIDLTPSGTLPPPRSELQNVVYDPTSNRLIVFGGYRWAGNIEYNDTWVLTNANGLGGVPEWQQLIPQGALPSVRQTLPISYDPNSNRLIIFGGLNGYSEHVTYDDSWVLTHANGLGGPSEWIKLQPTGPLPTGRRHYAGAYDVRTNRLLMGFGQYDVLGSDGLATHSTIFNDVWLLSNASGLCTASQPCTFQVTASDPDAGDALTYALDTAPAGMTIDATSGAMVWTPAIAQIGDHPVTVRVTDRGGLTATQSFTATVAPVAVPNLVGLAPEWAESFISAADLTTGNQTHQGGAITLNFDSLPSRQGWVFWGGAGISSEGSLFRVSGGSMFQNTLGTGSNVTGYAMLSGVGERLPFSIAVRARVIAEEGATSVNHAGFGFYAWQKSRYLCGVGLGTDAIVIESTSTYGVVAFDNTTFHDYILYARPSNMVYDLIADGRILLSRPPQLNPVPSYYALYLGDVTGGPNASAEVTAYSFTQPRVVAQNPPAGALVPNQTAVDLTIVDGPATETVPNLTGLTQAQASAAILAANLTVGAISSAPSATAPAGQVSDQSPLPNIHVPKNTPVNIVMSTGSPNRAPAITSAPVLNATAGQPYAYDVDATDPDAGDVLTYSLPTAPAGMTINATSGLIAWTPTAAQVGNPAITVRVTDPGGLFTEQTFTVTVSAAPPVNRPPVAVDDAFEVQQELAGSGRVVDLAFDRLPSAQGWTFQTNNASQGVTEGRIYSLCTPDGIPALCMDSTKIPYSGNDGSAFWYIRRDADLSQPFTIMLRARMLEERFEGHPSGWGAFGLYAGAAGTSQVFAFGIGIDPPRVQTYANNAAEVPVSFDPTQWHDYRLEVTPGVGFQLFVDAQTTPLASGPGVPDTSGPYLYLGDGTSFIAVRAEISRYTFISQPARAARGNVLANDSDPDGDTLTARLATPPNHGTALLQSQGELLYVPAPSFVGTDTLQYWANDGKVDSNLATVRIDVVSQNHPPLITSSAPTAAVAGQAYSYGVTAADPDVGDVLTFSLPTAPAGMTINATSGLIAWTPTAAQVGAQPVTVRVTDSSGLFVEQSFTVAVSVAVNQPPSITSTPSLVAAVDQPYHYQVVATDPDVGDTLTFSLPTAPARMSINPASGLIQFTPTADQIGTHSVTVRVTDRGGLGAEQSFVVIVSDTPIENRAPVAVAGLLGEPGLPACVAPPGELTSWYPGDSSFDDIVGISSPASVIGSPQLVTGKVGQAIKFNGTSGLIVPYNPTFDFGLTDSFTIDAWVRVDGQSGSGDNAIVDRRGPTAPRGYYDQRGYIMDALLGSLAPVGMTKFNVTVYERHSASIFGQVTTRAVPLGEAHFIAGVVDRQKQMIAIYLDGVLEQELSIAHVGEIASGARLFIGHHTSEVFTGVTPLVGTIDELEIISRALTQAEIQSLFLAGSAGKCKLRVGETVTLDGSGSTDADGDPLTYNWSLLTKPDGSAAALSNPTAAQPTFVVDLAGVYRVQLIVNDGQTDSAVSEMTLQVSDGNLPPIALDDDYSVKLGDILNLPAPGVISNDYDPNGTPLGAVKVTDPSHGTLTFTANGALSYTPDADVFGPGATAHTVIGTAYMPGQPKDIAINARINRIYVTNLFAQSLAVINGETGKVVDVLRPKDSQIEDAAFNPVANRIYVTGPRINQYIPSPITNFNGVYVYDGTTHALLATIPVDGYQVEDVAVNPATNRLYVASLDTDRVSVINGQTNAVIATIPVGTEPQQVAVDPRSNRVFALSTVDGTVTLIDGVTNNVVATVPVGADPRFLLVDEERGRVYVTSVANASVAVIDQATHTVINTIPVGAAPQGMALDPTTGWLYVANSGSGSVTVINRSTGAVVKTIAIGAGPESVAVNPLSKSVYVANRAGDTVSVINATTGAVSATVSVGHSPATLAVNPITDRVYTVDTGSHTISVVHVGDHFTYKVNDGNTDSNVATVTLAIEPASVAPVALDDYYQVATGGTLAVAAPGLLGNDVALNGKPLTAMLVSGPASGSLTLNADGSFTYTPVIDFSGTVTFTYQANDGTLNSNVATVTLTVEAVENLPPAITSTPVTAATAGVPYSYDVEATDPDGDPLTFSLPTAPTGMTVAATTGLIQWTPTAAQTGSHPVTVRVEDGRGGFATQSFTVTVAGGGPNAAPAITSTPPTGATVGQPYSYDADATDPDGDPLTYSLPTAPTGMTINATSGLIQWTPTAAQIGAHPVTVRVEDGRGGFATQSFTVTVAGGGPNAAPAITSTPPTGATVGLLYTYAVAATDPDNDPLSYTLTASPTGMTINATTGLIEWTPTAAQTGDHPVALTVADGRGGVASQNYTLRVPAVPGTIPVPDVIGATPVAADATLAGAGLRAGAVTTVDHHIELGFTDLPSAQDWLYGAFGNAAPETQVFTLADGVLRQNTLGLGVTQGLNLYQRADGVHPSLPFVLTVTARVLQEEGDPTDAFGFAFGFVWGTEQVAIGLRTTGVYDATGAALSTAIDTTQFHAYRIEGARGGGYRLFVDGILVGTGATTPGGGGAPFLFLGDASHTANARGEIAAFAFAQGQGLVVDQQPAAGVLVAADSPVALTVGQAPPPVAVPDVVGQPQAAAQTTLLAAPLLVGAIGTAPSATVPAGSVINQTPAAGVTVPGFTAVDLVISTGSGQVTVPNVVGLAQAAATTALQQAGLTLGTVTTQSSATVPAGRVIGQTPAAGAQVASGAAVNLVVSSGAGGPPPDPVPGLATILVRPASATILTGQTQSFSATGILTGGAGLSLAGKVIWASTNPAVASIDAAGVATASSAGTTTIRATNGAVTGSAALTVEPGVPNATPPTAEITAPADQATVTGPMPVTGTATDPEFLKYRLEIAPVGTSDFTTLAEGTAPVSNGTLGTLDPTLLINDLYTLRLTVVDRGGNVARTEIQVQLAREQKVGHFTLAFQDLSVPMACMPLTVTRVYDSRETRRGDFGVGWRLDVQTLRLRETGTMGQGWAIDLVDQPGPFGTTIPTYTLYDTAAHKVSLTLPDGHVEEFDLTPSPSSSQFNPIGPVSLIYTPRPGTLGSLAPASAGEFAPSADTGAVELIDSDATILDPRAYRYTTPEGNVYLIDKVDGVQQVQCTNGQTLTFTPGGIDHSDGKSAAFTRDAEGRITTLTDPAGNVQRYAYDANGDLASHTDAEGQVTAFTYDDRHRLLEVIDPRGVRAARNDYDADGRLASTTDPLGQAVTFDHDLVARTETVTDRLGHVTVYAYDDKGNVLRQTDALGGVTTRSYDAFGNELTRSDPLGRVTTLTYDSRRNPLTETNPLGRVTAYSYTALNAVRTVTDPLGRVTTNSYDANGNLTSTTDPAGGTTSYAYDARGLQTSRTDPLGQITRYAYNSVGNLIQETDSLGHISTYTYDANGNRLSETRTVGGETRVTTFEYDGNNRLVRTTHPDGSVTRTEYNAIGKPARTVDALGRSTSTDYDDAGRLTRTVYPDGSSETSTYDAEGRRTASTDRAGRSTSYGYDALGRLISTTFPDGARTATTYDAAGQVVASTDALGNTTAYQYDAAGRRTRVTDALGHVTAFSYDAAGNQTAVTDANGRATSFTYDANNRRTRTTYPDGTADQVGYDALGRQIGKTDQAGQTTQYGYDALGRLIGVTDALGQDTDYGYDEQGNQVSQTDANGNTTTFGYDAMGRRTSRTLPLGMTETLTYDAAGNLASKTDFNGRTTTYGYDALNRLTERRSDPATGEPAVGFTYTASGQRASMSDASGATTYTYDARDRLTQKATPQGTLSYDYDVAGNLRSIQSDHAGGAAMSYAYDALNRLESVTDAHGATTYAYDAVGNLASYAYPNGVEHRYTYNPLNRLTDLTVARGATTLARYAYTLGPAGNRQSVAELGGRVASYSYDALYRLTGETVSGDPGGVNGSIGYGYDPVGNRLTRSSTVAPIPAQTFGYDANDRITTEGYDDNGNTLATTEGRNFGYDTDNRLTAADGGVSFVYDGDGNRVARMAGGVTTQFLVDTLNPTGYSQVLEEIENGAIVRRYTYGLDLVSQEQSSGVSFYGYDGHGSVRLLADAAGAVTDTYGYDAFGNLTGQTGGTGNVYLYAGEQQDSHLGLYYLRARYLDSKRGRFYGMDSWQGTAFEPISLHKYLYGNGDPVLFIDPSGHFSLTELMASMAIGGSVNAIVGATLRGLNPTVDNTWGDLAKDAAVGVITAPIGGAVSRAVGPALRAMAAPVLRAVGQISPISLVGRSAVEKMLVRIGRAFVTTNKTYPPVDSTLFGRALIRLFPQFEWQQHHIFIQQAWFRVGSPSQLYDDILLNKGLQRLGNASWNLMPIPRVLNGWLGSGLPQYAAIKTHLFATFVYSAAVFGPTQLWKMVYAASEEQ